MSDSNAQDALGEIEGQIGEVERTNAPDASLRTRGRHSAATPRWGTPLEYVKRARMALGGRIELDPMSEPGFNTVVGAERIWTADDDCFKQDWICETMLINPAGGLVVKAWEKLTALHAYGYGDVRRAIWIGFSIEQLALLADHDPHPLDFSWCIPRKRIAFVRHDGFTGSPSHSNYIVGVGIDHWTFAAAFEDCGRVGRGSKAVFL